MKLTMEKDPKDMTLHVHLTFPVNDMFEAMQDKYTRQLIRDCENGTPADILLALEHITRTLQRIHHAKTIEPLSNRIIDLIKEKQIGDKMIFEQIPGSRVWRCDIFLNNRNVMVASDEDPAHCLNKILKLIGEREDSNENKNHTKRNH